MTRFFTIVLILIVFNFPALAQSVKKLNNPDFLGEQLNYQMEYLNLNVASLIFFISDTNQVNNRPTYHLTVTAKSTRTAGLLFKIDNIYHTYFNAVNFLPVKSIKKINQKNVQYDLIINFDFQKFRASIGDSISWSLPDSCFDYFSMLYFIRSQPLIAGDTLRFYLDSEYLISKVQAVVLSDSEVLKVPCGKFKTIKVQTKFQPVDKKERPWKTDIITNRLAKPGSELTFWFSDDEFRLPLKVSYYQSLAKTKIILNSYLRRKQD